MHNKSSKKGLYNKTITYHYDERPHHRSFVDVHGAENVLATHAAAYSDLQRNRSIQQIAFS